MNKPANTNYTLTINTTSGDGVSTENRTFTTNNPDELNYMMKLAGIIPYAEEIPATSCGCGGGEHTTPGYDEYSQPVDATAIPEMPATPYDGESDFNPVNSMRDWQARSYEKFTQTPSTQWPQVFEELTEELMGKGLSKTEAENKVLEVMSLDLTEQYDYGHTHYTSGQYIKQIAGGIDKNTFYRFKQNYVQSRYGDNPLSNNEGEDIAERDYSKLYEQFLTEAENSFTSKQNSKGEKVTLRKKKNEDGEFTVMMFKNGKRHEPGCYYTDDWADAVATFNKMKERIERVDESVQKKILKKTFETYAYRDKTTGKTRLTQGVAFDSLNFGGKTITESERLVREAGYNIYIGINKNTGQPARFIATESDNEGGTRFSANNKDAFNVSESDSDYKFPTYTPDSVNDMIHDNLLDDFEEDGFLYSMDSNGAPQAIELATGKRWITSGDINTPVSTDSEWVEEFVLETVKPKKVVLGKFVKNPELEITAVPVRDRVTGKHDYKVVIIDKFDNNNKQIVLLRGAGDDFAKMVERIKSTNELKFKRAGGVAWMPLPTSEISEHEDYMNYVEPLKSQGYDIQVSKRSKGGWLFKVQKDGKRVNVIEPDAGSYYVLNSEGGRSQEYASLEDALKGGFDAGISEDAPITDALTKVLGIVSKIFNRAPSSHGDLEAVNQVVRHYFSRNEPLNINNLMELVDGVMTRRISRMGDMTSVKFREALRQAIPFHLRKMGLIESGQRLDDKCWDGYKKGDPKTKISPRTGKRVNNCVPK